MKKIGILLTFILFVSCNGNNSTNEDVVKTVDKSGSIETALAVKHLNGTSDVLQINRKIWNNNNLVKEVISYDTIPALNFTRDTAENSDGEDTIVDLQKNYQIFITIK